MWGVLSGLTQDTLNKGHRPKNPVGADPQDRLSGTSSCLVRLKSDLDGVEFEVAGTLPRRVREWLVGVLAWT